MKTRILFRVLMLLLGLTLLSASIVFAEPEQPLAACPLPPAPADIKTCLPLGSYPPGGPGITCRCRIGFPTCGGTLGNDRIYGTNGNDVIGGYAGNDIICGFGGTDRLYGEAGNDYLHGGDGSRDECYGGPGLYDSLDPSCEVRVP